MLPLSRQAPAFAAAVRLAAAPLQRGLALLALFSSMTLASTAHAQPPAEPAPAATTKPAAKGKAAARSEAKAGGKTTVKAGNKVIAVDEEFFIEGRLEKPSAFYVLRRSSTDYDWARLDAVFTPLVLESVQDPLF